MLTVQSFTFNPVQENTFILYNEKQQCCIIDPGCYFAREEEEIKNFIKDNQLKPIYLLNTHCHLDHVFGNRFIHKIYGLPLYLNELELPLLQMAPASGQLWQLPFDNYDGPFHYLKEGDQIFIGNDVLDVLFTPGHSPGSISFYCNESKFVIAGDVLFNGSIGRTDLPGGDFDVLEKTIKTKLYTLPPDTIVYSGHGSATTIRREMNSNPFVKLQY